MHIVLQYLHFAAQKQMHGCIAYTNQGVETLPRAQVFSSLWFYPFSERNALLLFLIGWKATSHWDWRKGFKKGLDLSHNESPSLIWGLQSFFVITEWKVATSEILTAYSSWVVFAGLHNFNAKDTVLQTYILVSDELLKRLQSHKILLKHNFHL